MGSIIWVSAFLLAADRPAERVPSTDRGQQASGSAPAAPQSSAPASAPTATQPTPEAPSSLTPDQIISTAIPVETEAGPGCLKLVSLNKGSETSSDALYTTFTGRLINACGQPVVSYAGALTFTSQKGPISQSLGVYSAGGVPVDGANASWRFRVLSTAEDIWLQTAPSASMSWSWTAGYVLLADGTVYKGDKPIPDARR